MNSSNSLQLLIGRSGEFEGRFFTVVDGKNVPAEISDGYQIAEYPVIERDEQGRPIRVIFTEEI